MANVSQTAQPTEFHERLRLALTFKGLSPEQFSKVLDGAVTVRTIYRWLAGTAEPSIGALKLVAPALGVTADWLLAMTPTADGAE